jgi:hypothetical protein
VVVREGGLNQSYIDRDETSVKEIRDIRQKDGRIVRYPLIYGLSRIFCNEKGVMAKISFKLLIGVRSDPECPDMKNFSIEKRCGMRLHVPDESPDKILRLSAPGSNEDSIAPMDMAEDRILRSKFFWIGLLEFIHPCRLHPRSLLLLIVIIIISNFWEKGVKKGFPS